MCPLATDLLLSTSQLQSDLKVVMISFSSFLSSLNNISRHAADTDHNNDVADHLDHVHAEHSDMFQYLLTLVESLQTDLIDPVRDAVDDARPRVAEMDKNHAKMFRKMLNDLNNKKKELNRVESKLRKRKKCLPELNIKKECLMREIETQTKNMINNETKQIQDITKLEKDFYVTLGSGVSKVVQQELGVFGKSFDISREVLKLNKVLSVTEEQDDTDEESGIFEDNNNEASDGFIRVTPPTSPTSARMSLMKSISGSVMSLSSIMDDSLSRMKKKKDKDQIVLPELSELTYFNEVDTEEIEGKPLFDTFEEEIVIQRQASFDQKPSRSVSFSQCDSFSPVRPRFNSDPEVVTDLKQHLQYLDSQNDLIFNMVHHNQTVDQILNIG